LISNTNKSTSLY